MKNYSNIDDYIGEFSLETQAILQQIRQAIKQAAPEAQETISYGVPTFTLGKNLLHFGAYKHHIGFYPTPDGIAAFAKELAVYKSAKGSVQFPVDKPMPLALISQIAAFRVAQEKEKAMAVKKKK